MSLYYRHLKLEVVYIINDCQSDSQNNTEMNLQMN